MNLLLIDKDDLEYKLGYAKIIIYLKLSMLNYLF